LNWVDDQGTATELLIQNGDAILIPATIAAYTLSADEKLNLLKTFY
jgi:hypothetical protein